MIYIRKEPITEITLTCSHPKVKKIWVYGGSAAIPNNSPMFSYLCLQMDDETVKEFKDNGGGNAIEEAEEFLKSITV